MSGEFRNDPSFLPWGPFISNTYENESITRADVIIASIVWGLTLVNIVIAVYHILKQTRGSRSPIRCVYIWMVWLELIVSFAMGLESFLHLLKFIRPCFAFYFTILFFWCLQVQLLLQIIINRIRIIVPDRKRSRKIMIATATFVTAINISVFNIWIPARLQINERYHVINEYWDRVEKGLYLVVDAFLNWYFLKTVKANLVSNGLTKYKNLVRFNQKIIVVSLLMDVMIIGAMSIPNTFLYIQFHPLAYLVKLNIEMTMANLIKRIAISTSRETGITSIAQEFSIASIAQEFSSSSTLSFSNNTHKSHHNTVHELTSLPSYIVDAGTSDSIASLPIGNHIKETREVVISDVPNPFHERRRSEINITQSQHSKVQHTVDDESDDEATLVE